jgi:hypothetical protein
MKALTLWQPYAQAIALGLKRCETRSWATRYRGPLAIHASVRPLDKLSKILATKYRLPETLPMGAVVATVELVDCLQMTEAFIREQSATEIDFGDWRAGRWAWVLENVRVHTPPIPAKGMQGLWTWRPEEIKF